MKAAACAEPAWTPFLNTDKAVPSFCAACTVGALLDPYPGNPGREVERYCS